MILRLSINLPEDASYLHMTRAVGRAVLESLQAQDTLICDVETILTELYSNVLRHAQSERGRFSITVDFFADRLVVTVEDGGAGFAFKDVPPIGTVRPDLNGDDRLGGYGLQLVAALSDKLQFHRLDHAGMQICAEKRMVYQTQNAADVAEHIDQGNAELKVERP